ncbi:carboxymuconolactone decarboxylase family protein [uncultured Ruegeria sp.]|uniref:carboxymuconolactone decarboxylase family protein n=1 Tax=uncultured Ruegeria sp. TaxID=259304 RepID=UPI0026241A11|nr:carboxymuconolactone decarboxylase family protein [uncultured Ruegeria sp.]
MSAELYTAENAPEGARPLLEAVQKKMGGFLPNLYRQMAGVPGVLDTYLMLSDRFGGTSFTPAEQQLVLLTASVRNGCVYCVAAHSSGARMAKLDKGSINAIRDGAAIEDARLQALRSFTEAAIASRGKVEESALSEFTSHGFTRDQAAEVLIGISMKALSNTYARMFDTPLDELLQAMAWEGNDRV